MRIAAISDTHGNLERINTIARETEADAVLHAGDFGFYDDASAARLSDRELNLHVLHSSLPEDERRDALGLPRQAKEALIRERSPLSELPLFLAGERSFDVPVYAVWGNHEDIEVVRGFHTGQFEVDNLHVLHERCIHQLGDVEIFGLGGNLLKSKKLLQQPIAGGAGRIWTTLSQFAELVATVRAGGADGATRIFVTHVSPGKEPFVAAVAAVLGVRWQVSGHMGAPYAMVWNEFAIREPEEAHARLRDEVGAVLELAQQQPNSIAVELLDFLRGIQDIPSDQTTLGRGRKVPSWFVNLNYLNLPDADVGYAVLECKDGHVTMETRQHW